IARGHGKALFEGLDQRFLPGLALELPSAEPDEDYDRRQREHGWHRKAQSQPLCQRNVHGASPPVKRPSAALWRYWSAIRRPLTVRNGNRVVIRLSGPQSSACTQYGGA